MLRKTAVIRNAKDMKEYIEENFTSAASKCASRSKAVGLAQEYSFMFLQKVMRIQSGADQGEL